MKPVFAFLLVVFLAFTGYHFTFRGFRPRLPLFVRQFYLTGTEFLFIGLLLGSDFLNLLDAPTRMGLAPLKAVVLGWIGFLYGFQFEFKKLRHYSLEYAAAAHFQGLITFALVFWAAMAVMPRFVPGYADMGFVLSCLMAAAAAPSGQTALALVAGSNRGSHPQRLVLLRYISSLDGLAVLAVFSLAYIFSPRGAAETAGPFQGAMIAAGIGLGILALFLLFLSRRLPEPELVLVVAGVVLLASGLSAAVGFSPLLTNVFVGICLVNISRDKERIYRILAPIEKPAYLLLLVFLGAVWRADDPAAWAVGALYGVWRGMGKWLSLLIVTRIAPGLRRYPPHLGLGLLGPSGLCMALLVDFSNRFTGDAAMAVIGAILAALVLSDGISPWLLKMAIREKRREA
jgi:hypothetical protein